MNQIALATRRSVWMSFSRSTHLWRVKTIDVHDTTRPYQLMYDQSDGGRKFWRLVASINLATWRNFNMVLSSYGSIGLMKSSPRCTTSCTLRIFAIKYQSPQQPLMLMLLVIAFVQALVVTAARNAPEGKKNKLSLLGDVEFICELAIPTVRLCVFSET